jgi:hypothetical protein
MDILGLGKCRLSDKLQSLYFLFFIFYELSKEYIFLISIISYHQNPANIEKYQTPYIMTALKKLKFLANLKVPWGPCSNKKKRKDEVEGNQEKENVSSVTLCNVSIKI